MAGRPSQRDGPRFVQYFGPILVALKVLGGSARPAEVTDRVAAGLNVSDEAQSELTSSGVPRFYNNQVAWARFYLAKAGMIDASRRGVWTLTEKGRAVAPLSHAAALAVFRDVQGRFTGARNEPEVDSTDADAAAPSAEPALSPARNHRAQVIEALLRLSPSGFEAFAQRVLRESGFQGVTVTGRSGDGGIDGVGILEVNPLVSFKVLFQCKRYAGSVGAGAVRDGVTPIELVDGEKLVDMLEALELGLEPVRAYRVDEGFFDEFA